MDSKSLSKKLEYLQQQKIIVPLGLNQTSDWCNSFILVPKPNGSNHLCLEPARLNQALIRLVHKGPNVNGLFPRLTNVCFLTLNDAQSGYFNLKLDKKS